MFSLGAIKNGAMSTDAIVSLDPEVSEQLLYRTKRAGHVASKMRFQSVQLIEYLRDGLWVKLARQANAAMAELARGLRDRERRAARRAAGEHGLPPRSTPRRVEGAGRAQDVLFYDLGADVVRLVTSWQTTPDDIAEALRRLDVASTPHRRVVALVSSSRTGRRTARPRTA